MLVLRVALQWKRLTPMLSEFGIHIVDWTVQKRLALMNLAIRIVKEGLDRPNDVTTRAEWFSLVVSRYIRWRVSNNGAATLQKWMLGLRQEIPLLYGSICKLTGLGRRQHHR